MLEYERSFWASGCARLAGVDEAGRGPLAGPVVAAAVVATPSFLEIGRLDALQDLTDSKQLTERQREHFYSILVCSRDVEIGVGMADVHEIDRLNILRATHLAMLRAVLDLRSGPTHILVDGLPVPNMPCPSTAVVGGDSRSMLVAAASVVAKVTRDRWMMELDRVYPQYGFAAHKGYGTSAHLQALFRHGPTSQHRRSFRPVREVEAIRARLQAGKEAQEDVKRASQIERADAPICR